MVGRIRAQNHPGGAVFWDTGREGGRDEEGRSKGAGREDVGGRKGGEREEGGRQEGGLRSE